METPRWPSADELPPPTAPDLIPVTLKGFDDEEGARKFGNVVATTVKYVSRVIDTERLDGVTVAFDYDSALKEIDRGTPGTDELTKTDDGDVLGVAMTPVVVRDGVVKGHIVFSAPFVLPLSGNDPELLRLALYLVAHECGHVQEIKIRDASLSGGILKQKADTHDEVLLRLMLPVWEEYAVCRSSAVFGAHQTLEYEQCLVPVLSEARGRANSEIRSYRVHSDVERVLRDAGSHLCKPLRFSGYLLGHLDGLGLSLDDVPRAQQTLAATNHTAIVDRLLIVLRQLWDTRTTWGSLTALQPLLRIGQDILASGGLFLRRIDKDRFYVDIPFRVDTMPQ